MNLTISISRRRIEKIKAFFAGLNWEKATVVTSVFFAVVATLFFFFRGNIVSYGDAESHLNIAKRVISSITPGFAQLGGIWLPLPHILMIPFVINDWLWRTGLAGSIVSGAAYVLTALIIYRLVQILTGNKIAGFFGAVIFATNLNILYMQSTPMTELLLIVFSLLSTYYFFKYLKNENDVIAFLLTALFGFCATLTRYDGWFLVLFEALAMAIHTIAKREGWKTLEGKLLVFGTLAFLGIVFWMGWDALILGNAFYFTNSQFSARTQQEAWFRRGELPAFHNFPLAFLYYFVTSMSNSGIFVFFMAVISFVIYLRQERKIETYLFMLILMVPFIFNVVTLFVGQSVIFIPHLTPVSFEWRLFNVRYGIMLVPAVAILMGYLFAKSKTAAKILIVALFLAQFGLYLVGYSKIITLADGTVGLSASKSPDAEAFMKKHYDGGLVLLDDYARTMSILRSGIPMQSVIYVGNKPYWDESLINPNKYATWIIMQKNDDVWKNIYDNTVVQGRLYAHFQKVYTSPNILIFKRYR